MVWIQSLYEQLPTHWAVLALIGAIGVSVVFIRALIRFALRAFLIGLVGFILLGALYYLVNYSGISL